MDIGSVGDAARGAALQAARPVQHDAPAPNPLRGTAPAAGSGTDKRPDPQQLGRAIEELNKAVKNVAPGIEFSVEADTHETVVKVVDQNTKEVLRQIPSEETIEIAKALDKLQGLLISNQA